MRARERTRRRNTGDGGDQRRDQQQREQDRDQQKDRGSERSEERQRDDRRGRDESEQGRDKPRRRRRRRRRGGRQGQSGGGGGGGGQQRNRRQKREDVGFWGDVEALPPARADVRMTDTPAAVPRSLGAPPLPGHEQIAQHYFEAVYDRAVATAFALAAAGGLIDTDAAVTSDEDDTED